MFVKATGDDGNFGIFSPVNCASRSLERFAPEITVDDILDNAATPEVAAIFLRALASKIRKGTPPSHRALVQLDDREKAILVSGGAWTVTSFEDILSMRFRDPIYSLMSSRDMVVPRDWLSKNARKMVVSGQGHGADGMDMVCMARVDAVLSAFLRVSGAHSLTLEMLEEAFGDVLCDVLERDARVCTMITAGVSAAVETLARSARSVSSASKAFMNIARVHPKRAFRSGDVRDAFAAPIAREAKARGYAFPLVVQEDYASMGLADVRALATTPQHRTQVVSNILGAGAKFPLASVSDLLKSGVVAIAGHDRVRLGGARDLVRACRSVGRAWVKQLLMKVGERAGIALASLDATTLEGLVVFTRVKDRDWLREFVNTHRKFV